MAISVSDVGNITKNPPVSRTTGGAAVISRIQINAGKPAPWGWGNGGC
ncbi:hypothetical protein ABTE87_20185 [Acinetobacter baumannii]